MLFYCVVIERFPPKTYYFKNQENIIPFVEKCHPEVDTSTLNITEVFYDEPFFVVD